MPHPSAAPHAKNPWLDCVRSLAIACVLLGHSALLLQEWPQLHFLLLSGYMGVEIFFVLSGFLIGGILWRMRFRFDAAALRTFWLRRWLRTLPNYFLFLLGVTLLAVLGLREAPLWPQGWWQYALFVQNLAWRHPDFFAEAWSLSVEEVFYLCLPLLAWVLCVATRLRVATALALLAAAVLLACSAARLLLAASDPALQWDMDFRKVAALRLDALVLGVLLAFAWQKYPHALRQRWLSAVLLLCFGFCFVYVLATPWNVLQASYFAKTWLFNLTSLGCAGLLLCGLTRPFPPAFCAVCGFFSRISYSAYLSNLSIALLLVRYSPWGAVVNVVVFWAATVAVSWLVFRCWERRFMRWRDARYGDSGQAAMLVTAR